MFTGAFNELASHPFLYVQRTLTMTTRSAEGETAMKSLELKIIAAGLMLMYLSFEVSSMAQHPNPSLAEAGRPSDNGQILSSKPWMPLPSLESVDEFTRNYFPKAMYEEARTEKDFDILEITYSSDGLPVRGLLIKPKAPGARRWPAIIFNRGGTGDYGRITDDGVTPCSRTNPTCLTVVDLYQFAKAGFVVIASDYRFHGPTAKRDEWGGVDVNDVLNLVPTLKSFDFVDAKRLYILGLSRGGTMAYLALKRGIPVNATAVIEIGRASCRERVCLYV